MVVYNKLKAENEVIRFCNHPFPRTGVGIARHLQNTVSGFYPRSEARKIVGFLKKNVLVDLEEKGFLIKYTQYSGDVWVKARQLLSFSNKHNREAPRGVKEVYQTNFLYAGDSVFPTVFSLPRVPKEMNLSIMAFLSKYKKQENYCWEILNLLLCASEKKMKDDLRIHLYLLPLDYNEIESLEKVLDFGIEFRNMNFPFKQDVNEAKKFLNNLAKNKK